MSPKYRSSIFTRLVATFLLIIIPLYFLGIEVFQWSRTMLRREIYGTTQSQVELYLNNLADDIRRIRGLQFSCFDDEDLNNLANAVELMDSYEKTKAVTRFQRRLTSIKDSSRYIQNVSAYIPSINMIINALGNKNAGVREAEGTEELLTMLMEAPLDTDSQIIDCQKSLIINASFPYPGNAGVKPSYVIQVELSKEAVKSELRQMDGVDGSKSMLMGKNAEIIVSSTSGDNREDFRRLISQYDQSHKSSDVSSVVDGKRYLLTYAASDYLGMTLSRYIPEEILFEPLKEYRLWYWVFSITAAILIVFYSLSTFKFILKPLRKLIKSFGMIEIGDFSIKIDYAYKDEFGYLYMRFNAMVEKLKTLIEQVYKQQILVQKAELKQLQSQINPHFLYNSFFILQRRIKKGDYENAEKFSENLGTYFKFLTRNATNEILLKSEVEHARIYAGIQAIRFSNRIKVLFGDLPADCENILVPRLIIQPILENAFEHGLEDKESDGILRISFQKSQKALQIMVEDNGDKITDADINRINTFLSSGDEDMEITGMLNIHKRIRLALGDQSGIEVMRGESGGLKVIIYIQGEEQPCIEC